MLISGSFLIAGAQVQFGVKAGYNLANLNFSGDLNGVSLKSKSDFSAGVIASVPLFHSCFLQPEVLYSGQGTSLSDSSQTGNLNYSYINVPVLFKYQHVSGLFAETGPQIGFLLSAKEKVEGQSIDVKSSTQSTDFSWVFGVGYKLPKINLGIDARYNLGLTNVSKDSGSETAKNSVFQFGLFYLFGGK